MNRLFYAVLILSLAGCGIAAGSSPAVQYKKWIVSKPILMRGPDGSFDNIAVKDPSIVFYNDKYHLFYTTKSGVMNESISHFNVAKGKWNLGMSTGYVAAATLEELQNAKRYDLMAAYPEDVIFDPQVFWFEPHKMWYMIVHKKVKTKRLLAPFYCTNRNIEDVNGWSKPVEIVTGKNNDEFWIDFWIICDDNNAFMFYSNQKGSVLSLKCPLQNFPQGFSQSKEQVAITLKGENENGIWTIFEGAQVYHVKNPDKYLFISECKYDTDTNHNQYDAKRRFVVGMVADKLEGPWTRLEKDENEFLMNASAMEYEDGSKPKYTMVSLPAYIGSGVDQRMQIDDFKIRSLFQAFDSSKVSQDLGYNELPWELAIMKNY